MYHVLLPVDDNDERLDKQIETLASLPGGESIRTTVLHVHSEIDVPADEAGKSVIESVNESIDELQGIPATVDRAVTEIDDLGIPVDAMTAQGKPTERIVDAAADLEADAILIAGKTRTPVGKAVFGSVTQGVVLESGRTVIVAGMT